jgi:metal-responsive CopG/Arc/MetJ family transcriptional regulator
MKEKTSITLSPELLTQIDHMAGTKKSRSAFIEDAMWQFIHNKKKAERRAHDLAILTRYASELNRQAEDGLEEQAPEQG